jgi:hypothetical protein
LYAVPRRRVLGFDLTLCGVPGAGATAGAGETLRVPAGTPIELAVAVEASDGRANDLRVAIVANGRAVTLERGATPYRTVYRTTTDGTPLVLRLEARGSQQRLLSNPIFVRP